MNDFDITAFESTFTTLIKSLNISSTVLNNRPKAIVKHEDFVVVRAAANVSDLSAYGSTKLAVDLFARDVENLKNSVKLGIMYEKLRAGMPAEYGDYLISMEPSVSADLADDYGFHARVVIFNIIIKSV